MTRTPIGWSLSARRAWIEISAAVTELLILFVALRKESVDRNLWWGVRKAVGSLSLSARRAWIEIRLADMSAAWNRSLSARRAWIEIAWVQEFPQLYSVALRKESVDRNHVAVHCVAAALGRSPQGERG